MQLLQRLRNWCRRPIGQSDQPLPLQEAFRTSAVLRRLTEHQQAGWWLGLIYLDIVAFQQFEQRFGPELAEEVLDQVGQILESLSPRRLDGLSLVAVQNLWGDDYIAYVGSPQPIDPGQLHRLSEAVKSRVERWLNPPMAVERRGAIHLRVGASLLSREAASLSISSQVYQAAKQAQRVAEGELNQQDLSVSEEFARLVRGDGLYSLYQPIVALGTGHIFGWEALMRGPAEGSFHSPASLLTYAEAHGQMWALERASRRSALAGLGRLPQEAKLFLNVSVQTMADPAFRAGDTLALLREYGLRPENIVFEITEGTSFESLDNFPRLVNHYREQGYLVAVDDVGAGYSGLRAIAELRPDFLKIDMALVQGCDVDPVKQAMLEAMAGLSVKIGSQVVAEGIETKAELMTVLRAGIEYGQGFLFSRPAAPPPTIGPAIERILMRTASFSRSTSSLQTPVGPSVTRGGAVPVGTPVREVAALFQASPSLEGVVVTEGERPVGLVMQTKLYQRLGVPYGVPLYYDRSVAQIMDANPLQVDGNTSLEQVTHLVALRDATRRYDLVVVTEQGRYRGILSVHQLLNAVAEDRYNAARQSNPLTGLPGNWAIRERLSRRQAARQPYSLIYADLDSFKIFNDNYGFEHGDRVLSLVARLLHRAIIKAGQAGDFLGHIGGDDFVIITAPERVDRLGRYITRAFDLLAPRFYSTADRAAGSLRGFDRQGQPVVAPLMRIALAVVDCSDKVSPTWGELGAQAAYLKRLAKAGDRSRVVRAHQDEPIHKTST